MRAFTQQLSHQAMVVSNGLFNFDYGLFYSITGALASYLIILIQVYSWFYYSVKVIIKIKFQFDTTPAVGDGIDTNATILNLTKNK